MRILEIAFSESTHSKIDLKVQHTAPVKVLIYPQKDKEFSAFFIRQSIIILFSKPLSAEFPILCGKNPIYKIVSWQYYVRVNAVCGWQTLVVALAIR